MGAFVGGVPLEDQEEQPEQRPQYGQGGTFGGEPLEGPSPTTLNEFDTSSLKKYEATNVRQPGYSPAEIGGAIKGTVQKAAGAVSDAFTGANRTEYDLPTFDLPFEFKARQPRAAVGMMATFDPVREMKILKDNYPDLTFSEDKFGNIIANGEAYGGKVGYINVPGLSIRDLADIGFQVGAFTPAGRAGQLAKTGSGRMTAVGSGAAATEAGLDITSQAAGGTDEVSIANIDKSNMAIAAIGGGAFEGIGMAIGRRLMPQWVASRQAVTDEIRSVFREEAARAGVSVEEVTDDMIRSYMDAAASAVDPSDMPALRDTGEFGIRYTKGQQTGETSQLQLEDRLRNGPSAGATKTMEDFGAQQGGDIMRARGNVQETLSGGHPVITHPVEAGEAMIEGARNRAAAELRGVDAAYEEVRGAGAQLLPQGQRGLVTRMERVAKANDFILDDTLAPSTKRVMGDVQKIRDYVDDAGNFLRPRKIMHVERVRRKINKYYNTAQGEDRRQVGILKREFDTYLDHAVDRALFSGDQEALQMLKKARGLHASYLNRFSRQDRQYKYGGGKERDDAGAAIQRMVEGEPTAEEAINFIFGVTKIGGRKQGARVAGRLKEILGEESAEWSEIRQAAFLKLTDPGKAQVISGEKFLTNLTEAGNNPTLFKTLFSTEEQQLMNRFARAVIRAQPSVAKYGNVSRSGHKTAEYVKDAWQNMVVGMGFATSGPVGGLAAKVGVGAADNLGALRARMKASAATSYSANPLKGINLGPTGAALAVGGMGD